MKFSIRSIFVLLAAVLLTASAFASPAVSTTVPPIDKTIPTPNVVVLEDINNELFEVVDVDLGEKFYTIPLRTLEVQREKQVLTPISEHHTNKKNVDVFGKPITDAPVYYDGYTAQAIYDMMFANDDSIRRYCNLRVFGVLPDPSIVPWGTSIYYNYGYMQLYHSKDDMEYFACYCPFNNTLYEYPGKMSQINNEGLAKLYMEDETYTVKFKPTVISVLFDGARIGFDQLPVIDNGRTLVPLRAIFEKIGAEVKWDAATRTVTAEKDGTVVSLTIDKTDAVKNGETVALDVPAKIVGGRTMVPVRFVSDCFGVGVEWDGSIQTVKLTTK